MKYGYARVSTTDQKLANQIELLKLAGAEKIFQEKFTGTTTERPEFQKLLRVLKTGDTLIVTKLDRFARNTREALAIIQELFKENVKVNILNMGLIDNTPTGQLVFTIFSAFAQFERDMIVTRTQEGKLYAKQHDPLFREGRPKTYSDEQIRFAYELRQQGMTYKMIERKTGISKRTQQRRFKLISQMVKMEAQRGFYSCIKKYRNQITKSNQAVSCRQNIDSLPPIKDNHYSLELLGQLIIVRVL